MTGVEGLAPGFHPVVANTISDSLEELAVTHSGMHASWEDLGEEGFVEMYGDVLGVFSRTNGEGALTLRERGDRLARRELETSLLLRQMLDVELADVLARELLGDRGSSTS